MARRFSWNSKLAEEVHDFWLRPVHRTKELTAHHATAIDDVTLWKFRSAVEIVAFLIGITDSQQLYFVILQKSLIFALIYIHTYRQYGHTFSAHSLLHLHKRRHLLHTGRTPGRPKIQHHYFAAQIAQANLAVGILDCEVGGGAVNVSRPRTAVTSGQQQS